MDRGALPVSDREYWFARRYPLKDRRQGIAPIHWKGYAVSLIFVCALTAGGVAFAWLGAHDDLVQGVAVFAAVCLLAGLWFTTTAKLNGDPIRTVEDYKKDKQQRV